MGSRESRGSHFHCFSKRSFSVFNAALYVVLISYLILRPWFARRTIPLPTVIIFCTLFMFAIYALYWALDIYLLWGKFEFLLSPQPANTSAISIQQATWKGAPTTSGLLPQSFPMVYVQWVAGLALIVLGDFVSLWRTWAIYGKPRWLYILLMCTAVVESVVFILMFASTSPAYFPTSSAFTRISVTIRIPLTFIGYSVTGVAQLASTSLIAYKAWTHWKDVREIVKSPNVAALVVVIETGIVYVAILASYGFMDFFGPHTANWTVTTATRFYSIPLIAMYPTLVVVLVASRRTVLEEASGASMGDMRFTSSLANGRESLGHTRYMTRPEFALRHSSLDLDKLQLDLGGDTSSMRGAVLLSDEKLAQRRGTN